MSWHAVRAIREAGVTTRAFLFPVERGRWLRLAALSLVVGVGWLAPAVARAAVPAGFAPGGLAAPLATAAVGGVALAGLLADAYGRFALLSALRSRRLRLTEDVRWRLGRALRWGLFGLGAGVLVAAAAGVALRALRAGWLAVTGGAPASVAGFLATALAGGVALLIAVAVVGFVHATLSLLPAAMLATGVGPLGAWRRLWGAFAGYRGGVLGYLLVRGVVALAVTAVALLSVGALLAGFAVVAFVGLVAAFGTVSAGVSALGGLTTIVVGAALAVALAVLPVRVATLAYLTSYDLAVLGAADPDLGLLGGVATVADDGSLSVVLPDGTRAGHDPETGTDADGDGATGAFQFGAVEED